MLVDHDIELRGQRARYSAWRAEPGVTAGTPVHLFHATGFPLRAYRRFVEALIASGEGRESASLVGLWQRGTWPGIGQPPSSLRWDTYASDLITFLEATEQEPVIAIGHSSGATATAIAAAQRPDLFRALVLIEPATITERLAFWERWLPYRLRLSFEPARSTARKRDHWESKEEAYLFYRAERSLRRLDDEALADFVEAALRPHPEGGFALTFDRRWETHSYMRPGCVVPALRRLEVPTVAIRARPSVFLNPEIWRWWQREDRSRGHASVFYDLPAYGHLAPLEGPVDCARAALRGLAELGRSALLSS